jgi:hypothetical protein
VGKFDDFENFLLSFSQQEQFSFLTNRNSLKSAPKSSTLFENIPQIYQNVVYGRALNRELNDFLFITEFHLHRSGRKSTL